QWCAFLCGSGKVAALSAFSSSPLSLNEQKIQGGIDPFLANVMPLRTVRSHDPVPAVVPHDFDVAVYRSPLPSVTQRNECEVGKTPRSAIGHRQRSFPQPSSASRFTAGAADPCS